MMFGYGSNWAFWQVALMWVVMIGFWSLVIWWVYALVTNVTRRPTAATRGDDTRHILDQRLAKGEIDAEEYHRLREIITADRTPVGAGDRR